MFKYIHCQSDFIMMKNVEIWVTKDLSRDRGKKFMDENKIAKENGSF